MFKKILAGFLILIAFGILIRLGFWQLDRLEWKNDIIATITAQPAGEAQLLAEHPVPYSKSRIQGQIIPDIHPVFIGPRIHEGKSGYHVLSPYRIADGTIIMVNWGWVAEKKQALTLPESAAITGYITYPKAGLFTAANRPQDSLWYWADTKALAEHYGFYLQDFVLNALADGTESVNIIPFEEIPLPRNKHLHYALFWFGMAGLLVILSCVSLRRSR